MLTKKSFYNNSKNKDFCGTSLFANIYDIPSRDLVSQALVFSKRFNHNVVMQQHGIKHETGVLLKIPHQFFQRELAKVNVILPSPDEYAVGIFLMPKDYKQKANCIDAIKNILKHFNLEIFFLRPVPIKTDVLKSYSEKGRFFITQIFIKQTNGKDLRKLFNIKLYQARNQIIKKICFLNGSLLFLSSILIYYRGASDSFEKLYPDLSDYLFTSSFALVHHSKSTHSISGWEVIHSIYPQVSYLTNGEQIKMIVGKNKKLSLGYVLRNDGFFYFPENNFSIKNHKNDATTINFVADGQSLVVDLKKKKVSII